MVFYMDDEPDIVKMLREEEKLGVLHCSIQELIGHNDKVDDTSEEIEAGSVKFTDDDIELASVVHIKALFLAISEEDYNQILLHLKKSGYTVDVKHVSSEKEFEENLQNYNCDIILADYVLSDMSLSKIISIVKNTKPETPIILVSEKLNEDEVISYLDKGASNYILKDDLKRTGFVVKQTLELASLKKTKDGDSEDFKILKDSEDRFYDLFENANDLIQAVKPDGSFLYVNSSWKKTLGYSDKEVSNLNVFDIIAKESVEHCKEAFKKIMSGERVDEIETTFLTKNGKKVHLQGSISCRFKEGKPYSTRGIFRDVTEKKNIRKKLEEINDKYQALFDRSLDSLYLHDFKGNILDANPAALKLFGYTKEELSSINLASVLVKKDVPKALMYIRKIKKNGFLDEPIVYKAKTKDGRIIFIETTASVVYDEGKPSAVLGIARDVTEEKKAEEKFRTIFDSSTDAVFLHDMKDFSIIDVNEEACRRYGYTKKEMLTKHVDELSEGGFFSLDNPETKKLAKKVFSGETVTREWLAKTKKGDLFWTEVNAKIIDFDEEKVLLVVARDISKRKEAEEKIKQSQENYETIFNSSTDAVFIHDFKNGKIIDVNKCVLDKFGYTKEEIKNLNVGDLSVNRPPYTQKEAAEWIKKAVSEGPQKFEWCSKTKKGEIIWHENVLQKVNIGGEERVLVIGRDITDRKKSDDELKTQQSLLQQSEKLANMGSWEWDLESGTIIVSEQWQKIHGINKAECYKNELLPIAHPDDRGKIEEAFKKTIKDHVPYDIEHRIIRGSDKETRIIKAYGEVSKGESGSLKIIGYAKDITDFKQTEEKYKALFEYSKDAIMTLEPPTWKFTSANKATLALFNIKDEKELVTLGPWDVSPKNQPDGKDSGEKAKQMIQKAMNKGSSYFEWAHKKITGEEFFAKVLLTKLEFGGKKLVQATVRDITKEKIVEGELKQSSENLKNIIDTVQAGILLIDEKTHNILEVNNLASDMIGLPKEKIIGRLCHSFICPAEKGKCPISDLKKTVDKSEKVLIDKDKNKIKVLKTVKPIKLGSKKVLLESFVDITDIKRAEKETEDILNAAADGIRIVDKSYNIVKMNETLAEMCGVDLDKTNNKKCRELFSSKKCGTKDCALATVLRTKKSFQREQIMKTKDGKEIPCLLKAMPYKDSKGNVIGIIEDYRDISHIKEAQEKLKKSYEIINKSPVVAFTWKSEEGWPVDYVSDNVKDLFGYTTKEFTEGKIQFSKTIHPDDLERVGSEVEKYSEDKKCKEFEQEYRIITKKGAEKWIYDRTMLRRDEKGNPVFFDGVILDVTEDKRKENELKEKIEELERYKKVTVGREIKMIDLKEKIKKLEGDKK